MKKKTRARLDGVEGVEQRARLIRELPLALGVRWASDALQAVALEGRKIEGGWPGTVPEARGRVRRELTQALEALRFTAPAEDELATATASAYESAREEWRRLGRRSKTDLAPSTERVLHRA
jgi:hypothetical protein